MKSIWTNELANQLSTLWQQGLSTAEIGRKLHISKNAVVGKAHRMMLPPRPLCIKGPIHRSSNAKAGSTCVWPKGHPGSPGFRYCGKRTYPGKSYCPEHNEMAHPQRRAQ